MSRHADAVLATIEKEDATSMIAVSWRRCATTHRLDPDGWRIPDRDPIALREAEERNAKLISIASPYLDQLFEALADPVGSVVLGDRHGLIVSMRVGGSQDVHERRPWRRLGVSATEALWGTNGIGTCLAEARPVIVDAADHFVSPLIGTTCVAAPIFGPEGSLVGVLNAAMTEARARQIEPFVQMAVKSFAKRIEVEFFAATFPETRLCLASDVGRSPGALLAVDRDGIVVGATRAARRLLELDAKDIASGIDYDSLCDAGGSERLADSERKLIARALARHGGNVTRAAKSLGISRSTFYRRAVPSRRPG